MTTITTLTRLLKTLIGALSHFLVKEDKNNMAQVSSDLVNITLKLESPAGNWGIERFDKAESHAYFKGLAVCSFFVRAEEEGTKGIELIWNNWLLGRYSEGQWAHSLKSELSTPIEFECVMQGVSADDLKALKYLQKSGAAVLRATVNETVPVYLDSKGRGLDVAEMVSTFIEGTCLINHARPQTPLFASISEMSCSVDLGVSRLPKIQIEGDPEDELPF